MRSKTANWFICKIRYAKVQEDGVFDDGDTADRWYNAKLEFITIDEKTEKEKRSAVVYLVQAGAFDGALKNVKEVMGSTMIDYGTAKIEETKIMDVFEYVRKEDTGDEENGDTDDADL